MSDLEAARRLAEFWDRPRSGCWRRWGAFLVDAVVVTVPFQILVVLLFAMTHGTVQITTGIIFSNCPTRVSLLELPSDLEPSPPEGANYAYICRSSFFGWETARWLTVGRFSNGRTIGRNYRLDTNNEVTNAWTLDWIAYLTLFVYLIGLERRYGATLGKWLAGIRVVDTQASDTIGIPLHKAVGRNVLIWAGMLPMLIVLFASITLNHGDLEATFSDSFFRWYFAAGLLTAAWQLWIAIEVARKHDPIYDRIAGTAVLRV